MTRYQIQNTPVGQGGFGKVRPGHDSILDRKVAVKTLDPAWPTASTEDQERFKREAKVLATLSHPNIPAIYDVNFGDGDRLEIIFQFVEGETLRQRLESGDPIPLSHCRSWFDQLASALHHAHEKGIVHRDIKPENIIISPDSKHCYLVDFGIALSKVDAERLTGSGWIGTPGYMSPEQESGDSLDSSDDLYVLGGVLYEALSGHRIEQGDYKPLSTVNELVPPAVDTLIKRCISQKPRRLNSADEFRQQLRTAFQGHRSFSEILASGQLHEIVQAISEMSPAQFMELKMGQRLLVLQRCFDVVATVDRRFAAAKNEFLEVMTCLGLHLDPVEYERIIQPAIQLGFGAITDADPFPKGVQFIREALIDAAAEATHPNHHVIVEKLLGWLSAVDLPKQKGGLFHSVRLLVQALMANTECQDDDAPLLAKVLATTNEIQRTRASEPDTDNSFGDRIERPSFTSIR